MNKENEKIISNMIKNHWKSIIGIIICVVITTFVINIVIFSKMPFNLPIAENNDWIGFWGSVLGSLIGGLISVYILSLTIYYNQSQIKNQRKMEISPYLKYSILNASIKDKNTLYLYRNGVTVEKCKEFLESNISDKSQLSEMYSWKDSQYIDTYRRLYKDSNYVTSNCKKFILNIENLGLNHATDLNIKKITFGEDIYTYNEDFIVANNGKIYNDYGIDVLKINETLKIQIGLCLDNNFKNDIDINIVIEYRDLLMNIYQQNLELNCIYETDKYNVYLSRYNIQSPVEL